MLLSLAHCFYPDLYVAHLFLQLVVPTLYQPRYVSLLEHHYTKTIILSCILWLCQPPKNRDLSITGTVKTGTAKTVRGYDRWIRVSGWAE